MTVASFIYVTYKTHKYIYVCVSTYIHTYIYVYVYIYHLGGVFLILKCPKRTTLPIFSVVLPDTNIKKEDKK